MKISLVVATGAHQGKVINIPGPQFVIGRDEGCHLRPASPAVSKKHCVVFIRNDKAYVRDMGSTNGTFINDEQIQGDQELSDGARLRVGPLDFSVALTPSGKSDSTPLPESLKSVSPSSMGLKKPSSPAAQPTPKLTPAPMPKPAPAPASTEDEKSHDDIAAMLLGMGDEDSSEAEVPGGSTIMELPSVDAKPGEEKPDEKKKSTASAAETSAAASEILRRYMRRPK
jgi:pSer/pThr/pTyr-binding forkhead associated (FHA) protein